MDAERVSAISELSSVARELRGIQRQVHGGADGVARRLVRDAALAYPCDVSQLLLSARSLAVHGAAPGPLEQAARALYSVSPRKRAPAMGFTVYGSMSLKPRSAYSDCASCMPGNVSNTRRR